MQVKFKLLQIRRLYKWRQMAAASVVLNKIVADNGHFYSLFKESNYSKFFSFLQTTHR